MSGKRGWPKGKPRGRISDAHRGALIASGLRGLTRKKKREVALASGMSGIDGGQFNFRPAAMAAINITPAAWKRAQDFVDDFAYVENGCDDGLLRDLRQGVVYAGSVTCHHEVPFDDVTIKVISEVERYYRKLEKRGLSVRKRGLPLPGRSVEKRPLTARQLEIIGFLAAGLTKEDMGRRLGISARTVKMHCDVLRFQLGVSNTREIPLAYREKTGKDPFTLIPGLESLRPVERVGTPLTAVVADMFKTSKGRPLLEVVLELFDPLKGAA